jgi:serine/threonine protein kinase
MIDDEKQLRIIELKKSLAPYSELLDKIDIDLKKFLEDINPVNFYNNPRLVIDELSTIIIDMMVNLIEAEGKKKIKKNLPAIIEHAKKLQVQLPDSFQFTTGIMERSEKDEEIPVEDLYDAMNRLPDFFEWYRRLKEPESVFDLEGCTQNCNISQDTIFLIRPGNTFGEYTMIEKLGQGGMAVVWKAECKKDNNYRALKFLPETVVNDRKAFKQLKEEFEVARGIEHPNVVRYLSLEKPRGLNVLVMEYIEGENLLEKLKKENVTNGLDEKKVIMYMMQVAEGLKAIQDKNVFHMDLKPLNIMITKTGNIKILDFSISRFSGESSKDIFQGTWPYMAPEALDKNKFGSVNKQTDIWSFGATMYYLLSAKYPFESEEAIRNENIHPKELTGVSKQTNTLVMKCLQRDRKNRFEDMLPVLNIIREIKENLTKRDTSTKPKPSGKEDATTEVKLREKSSPSLTEENVREVIEKKNFFDSNFNKTGDFKNDFTTKSMSKDQVICDARTRLMWHSSGSQEYMGFESVKRWLENLNSSSYGGFSDWRLPTLEEALSLLSKKKSDNSLHISSTFSSRQECIYTCDKESDTVIWVVDFVVGNAYPSPFNYGYVRPVRKIE